MKLNENGDFCLLYVEPEDEKQSLFETIGAQKKPVVLMLPLLSGRPRSRLFQRPEDFSDLKHVRRQTGVSVVFLTAGSEFLAQQAIRYGFPAYPSIDAFADMLAYGHHTELNEGEPKAPRRARTGPLVPSAAQLAAIRRSVPTSPLNAPQPKNEPWPTPESGALPIEYPAVFHQMPTAPLGVPADLAFWETPEDSMPPGAPLTPPVPGKSRATPPPGRLASYLTPASPAREMPFPEEDADPPAPRFSEIPRRRSAQLPEEPYTRHPDRGPEERVSDRAAPLKSAHGAPALAPGASHAKERQLTEEPEQLPPVQPPELKLARKRHGFSPLLLILSLLILSGAGLGSFLVISRAALPAPTVVRPVGSITFLSSEQVNENTSQGIDDQVQITLHNLGSPAPGKSYYAWLLGDKTQTESQSILLGKLNVVNGSVKMLYAGDAQHTNLLQLTSRFLITEEDSSVTPLLPSPDTSTWRYYGALPATPDPNDAHHFSFLNHLRHLLADEPILDEMELPGGLNNWFTRNTEKLIEWTSSARDRWQDTHDLAYVRDEGMQILSYLDGMSFVVQDLPPASAKFQVSLDTHLAALGLLNVRGPGQNPPSYMDQIVYHLNGLINAPGSPASVRNTAAALLPAMSNVTTWLQNLRGDDKRLLAMTSRQMGQPAALSLLDDMVLQASNAYTGSTDASTGQVKQGVVWIHQQLQSLAAINISTYVPGAVVPEIGPVTPNAPSFVAPLLAAWKEWGGLR
jgi:hypothetical protein